MSEQFPNSPADSERQARVERLVEEGHSLAHAVGTAWGEQDAGFTAPPEHGVDKPGTTHRRVG